jgi:hypothetical protein
MNLSRKYERYRKILKTRFLVVGREQGHSLPADNRDSGRIHFGDATVFLGWYLGVLATEFYLLSRGLITTQALSPQKTLRELYFAINALRRLIDTAARCFRPSPVHYKGFFIRDDVPKNLQDHFPGVNKVESDYLGANRFMKEESQDQLIHLLLGLALVKKFVPQKAIIQGENLVAEAQNLALDICSWPSITRWIIRNPYVDCKKVDRGPHAFFFSHPIVTALEHVIGQRSGLAATVNWLAKLTWRYLMKYDLGCLYKATNLHLTLTVACLSDSWGRRSLEYILRLAKKFDWPVYPMISVVLFSNIRPQRKRAVPELKSWAGPILRAAPKNGLSYQGSPAGWKASHKFLFDRKTQTEGRPDHTEKEFPGVDFMLLHNIYRIMINL